LADFRNQLPFEGVHPRQLQTPRDGRVIVSIIGPRRAGKTFYLRRVVNDLLAEGVPPKHLCYVNFEDERLELSTALGQTVLDAQQRLCPDVDLADCYFFFDEVQLLPGWETFLRRVADTVSGRLFVTGSSATLLSREIATALRGRTVAWELLPLSFAEFAAFSGVDAADTHSSRGQNRLAALFDVFLRHGGYPQAVGATEDLRLRMLQSYVELTIFRDVIERHTVARANVAKDMLKRLLANSARVFSVNKYYHDLRSRGVAVGKDTVYALLDHFVEAFAVLPVSKWDPSPAKRENALRKVYAVDTGLITAVALPSSDDRGWLLETCVRTELAKRGQGCFYFANGGDCDFVVEKADGLALLQVCYELTAINRKRELGGLVAAAKRVGAKKGVIVTHAQAEVLSSDGITVEIRPAWRWALQG